MRHKAFVVILVLLITSCSKNQSGISIVSVKEFDSNLNYRIDISYPQFQSTNAEPVNAKIKEQVDSNIFEFKMFIVDFDGYSSRNLTYNYEIKTNNEETISIAQRFEWAVPGVERILYYHNNLNYDKINHRFITVNGLFKEGVNFRDSIREISTAICNKIDSNCLPEPQETFENCYFDNDSIYFNLLTGDYAQCNEITIAISKKQLNGLLK